MSVVEEKYDVVVVGAGHAGCEAALACARLGLETIIFTVSLDSVALMPCNPNIGGSSKGHLVRELDALGGEMGKNIDKTFLQSRMLNESKGPAVHSLRAQADKQDYIREMRTILENTEHLTLKQAEVSELLWEDSDEGRKVIGVKTISGAVYRAGGVILCTGVYLKSCCIYGDVIQYTGPNGLMAANHLTASLLEAGIELRRFKTGTPARVSGNTIDYSRMEEQKGDEYITPFSFSTDPDSIQKEQISCWLTYTNEKTHEIIRENLDRSPLYSGVIQGTGPRYCPSIEDKIVRFSEKERHQIFVEPEGMYTNEMYLSGLSSSMPEDVQDAMIHTIPGLENCKIARTGYAIEYDCLGPRQLNANLELKKIKNLYCAGQINGSSGYEEAAAQGLMAGINCSRKLLGKEEIVLDRSQAYIGVLIDDLVTKDNPEPYRMMTSRAEYRLLLRQDNADIRLRKIGYEVGLVSEQKYSHFLEKKEQIDREIDRVEHVNVGTSDSVQNFLEKYGSTLLKSGSTLADLIRRPELTYDLVAEIDPDRPEYSREVRDQVNIELKYGGYIKRQMIQVEKFRRMEEKKLPIPMNYEEVPSLRLEAVIRLNAFQPENIGQASRISGVNPADISMLLVYMERKYRSRTNK